MKKLYSFLIVFISLIVFTACTGKVQTNKIPNDSKYILPKGTIKKETRQSVQTKELADFSNFLVEFFGQKRSINVAEKEPEEDIFQTGLDRKYFYLNNATKDVIYYDIKERDK